MQGALLGPSFSRDRIKEELGGLGAVVDEIVDESELCRRVAAMIAAGKVVAWFQSRMEFGPRSLGNRSLLGDPRNPTMQSTMNLKTKFRESFRPFAPAVLKERAADYFALPPESESPYMLLTAQVAPSQRLAVDGQQRGLDRLHQVRSTIPAVTHVDGSARVQTVDAGRHPRFHRLLEEFERQTGCPLLINTSFNVRGEPIVCTPEDAYRCFLSTNIDVLVVGDFLLLKEEQPQAGTRDIEARLQAFPLD